MTMVLKILMMKMMMMFRTNHTGTSRQVARSFVLFIRAALLLIRSLSAHTGTRMGKKELEDLAINIVSPFKDLLQRKKK